MNELNQDAVFAFEPAINPFYEPSCSHRDVAEIAEQLDMEDCYGEY